VGENRNRCLPAARWFFDDVLFSRIALTTLAQWGDIPIVLRYRKRTGEKSCASRAVRRAKWLSRPFTGDVADPYSFEPLRTSVGPLGKCGIWPKATLKEGA